MRTLIGSILLLIVLTQQALGDDTFARLDVEQLTADRGEQDTRLAEGFHSDLAAYQRAPPNVDDGSSDFTPGENSPGQAASIAGLGIAGNPAAVNITVGNGRFGRWLGIPEESGVRLGGLWVGDASGVLSGGLEPGQGALNSLAIVNLSIDAAQRWGWEGASFGAQYLNFTGQATNSLAGTVQGFDGLQSAPPFNRNELYQLWWRQSWFDGKLITRLGKSVPTYDFDNVLSAVPVNDSTQSIPAVSSLIYTPIFVNPTILGRIPGYYDSATGLTATFAPSEKFYASYGLYDGNNARGDHTGTTGPHFNGYYFHIGEVGRVWQHGPQRKPGKLGAGVWGQTGNLPMPGGGTTNGDMGLYLFGSQRLWFQRPGKDNSGVSGFFQFGANNSNSMLVRDYFGCGLTAFGLVSARPKDTQGVGLAWSFLNNNPSAGQFFFPNVPGPATQLRSNELMMAGYYQMTLWDGAFLQPTLTYIPNPGVRRDIPGAFALSTYLIMLF